MCLFSFLWLEELIDVVFQSLSRSSHCPTCFGSNAEAWIQCCCFLCPSVSGCEAIPIANLHFIFLCVSTQQCILAALIFSSASVVLLFIYSIHYSSSISAVSMSSSASSMKETSLSWLQSVFELLPSSVSSSEFCLTFFCLLCHFFHLLAPHHTSSLFPLCASSLFFVILVLVCMMRRSILRCVDRIILLCSCERECSCSRGVCQRRRDDHTE